MNRGLATFFLATLLLCAASSGNAQPDPSLQLAAAECSLYKFANPAIPILTLPALNKPDTLLNSNNPIVINTGAPIPAGQGCNGNKAEYLDDNLSWNSTWRNSRGDRRDQIEAFYATNQIAVVARTLQSEDAALVTLLTGRLVRLSITCQNGVAGTLQFFVNSGRVVQNTDPCKPPNTDDWSEVNNPKNDDELSSDDEDYPNWTYNLPCCFFRFDEPQLPVFKLNQRTIRSDDNTELNPNNMMVYRWGEEIPDAENCQGTDVAYLTQSGQWQKSWNDRSGVVQGDVDMFYANRSRLYLSALKAATASDQLNSLSGKLIRLNVTCRTYQGCVLFSLNGGHKASTLPRCKAYSWPPLKPVLPSAPVRAPVASPISPPIAAPISPPIRAPISPPVATPINPPVAAPVNPPVAAPINPPVAAPMNPPVAAPINPPVAAPMNPPVAAPINPPVAAPVNPPVAAPINPPVAAPVNPPVAAPLNPPVAAPMNPNPPQAAPIASPFGVQAPFVEPVSAPVQVFIPPPESPIIVPPTPTDANITKLALQPNQYLATSSADATQCGLYGPPNAAFHVLPPPQAQNCSLNVIQFDYSCTSEGFQYVTALTLNLWASLSPSESTSRVVCLVATAHLDQSIPAWKTADVTYDSMFQMLHGFHPRDLGMNSTRLVSFVGGTMVELNATETHVRIPLDWRVLDILNRPRVTITIDQCQVNQNLSATSGPVYIHSRLGPTPMAPRIEVLHDPNQGLLHACRNNSDCSNALCIPRDEGKSAFCSCHSGWYTKGCLEFVSPKCDAEWKTNQWLETNWPPKLDVGARFECGAMRFLVKSPLVTNRRSTEITFNYNQSSSCSYPGFFWNKGMNETDCQEQWSSNIPWTLARNCVNWIKSESTDRITYSSYLVVKHVDYLGMMRGSALHRTMQHIFPIAVRFPKNVLVSTQVRVFAPVRLLGVINAQIVSFDTTTSLFQGNIKFITSLQWPFTIVNATFASGPPLPIRLLDGVAGAQDSCDSGTVGTNETECRQNWQLQIDPPADACEITGTYLIDVVMDCRPNIGVECPLGVTLQRFATIQLDIVSERFCAINDFSIPISGTLKSYSDEELTVQATSFLQGRRAYFLANAIVDSDLASTEIVELWVEQTNSDGTKEPVVPLKTQLGLTSAGSNASLTSSPKGPDAISFSFFPDQFVRADSSSTLTVFATLQVTYAFQSIGGVPNGKRSVVEFTTKRAALAIPELTTAQTTRASSVILLGPGATGGVQSPFVAAPILRQGELSGSASLPASAAFALCSVLVALLMLLN